MGRKSRREVIRRISEAFRGCLTAPCKIYVGKEQETDLVGLRCTLLVWWSATSKCRSVKFLRRDCMASHGWSRFWLSMYIRFLLGYINQFRFRVEQNIIFWAEYTQFITVSPGKLFRKQKRLILSIHAKKIEGTSTRLPFPQNELAEADRLLCNTKRWEKVM